VGLVVLGEREARVEVLAQGGLGGLKILYNSIVNTLLEGNAVCGHGLLGVFLVEEVSARLSVLASKGLVSDFLDIDSGGGHLGGGRDRVDLVHASERNSIHFAGAGHEQETRLELLKEHDALSSETAGGHDEYAASFDSFTELGGGLLSSADGSAYVFGRVPVKLFDH